MKKILGSLLLILVLVSFSSCKSEAKIIVDENCHPIDIKLRNEGTGENIIENFIQMFFFL